MSGVLVLGGNRATGLEIVKALRAREIQTSVLVRPTAEISALQAMGAEAIVGQAVDSQSVTQAVSRGSFRALICAVGGSLMGGGAHYEPTKNMIDAARGANIQRVIMISSIGVGDSHDALPVFVHWILGRAMKQKERAEVYVKASGLDYTIIRPGNLTTGPATSTARLVLDPKASGKISRADVGQLTAAALDDPAALGKTYAAVA